MKICSLLSCSLLKYNSFAVCPSCCRGCRSSIVRRLAFYPPQPAGYSIGSDNQLYVFDGASNQQQPSAHPAPPPDAISTSGLAPSQGSATSGDLQRESIQHLLRRTGLPEKVEVLRIPCGRKESLAGLFLYHPLNSPSIGGSNHNTSGSTPETHSGQPSTAHTPESPGGEGGSARYGGHGPGSRRLDEKDGRRRRSTLKEEGTGRTSGACGDPGSTSRNGGSISGFSGKAHRSYQRRSSRSSGGADNTAMVESARRLPCIIFSHGNSTDIGYMFGLYYRLAYK